MERDEHRHVELLGSAAEVDLDTVIVMDALAIGPISTYLCSLVDVDPNRLVSVTRSASRGDRETDVQIVTEEAVLLLENKVGAAFTPGQQVSYASEVARIRAAQGQAWSFVIHPASRSAEMANSCAPHFDRLVTIEDLIKQVSGSSDPLSVASTTILERCLRPRVGPEFDSVKSAWGDDYRAAVAALAQGEPLTIGPGALRNKHSTYVQFLGEGNGWVSHHVELGEVEAGLNGRSPDPALVPAGALVRTRNAIRRPVPKMSFSMPVSEQRDALSEIVLVVSELRRWLLSHP